MGEEDDPLASIAELCHISPSQHSLVRRRRSSLQDPAPATSSVSDEDDNFLDSAYLPAESALIIMASPPESTEEENSQSEGLFHTPPDGSLSADQSEDQRTVEVGSLGDTDTVPVDFGSEDSFPSVNSRMYTDLGFLQEDLKSMQRTDLDLEQNAAFQSHPDESRVSTTRSTPVEQPIEESPSKRLKIAGIESPDLHLGSEKEKPREEIPNFFEKLNSRNVSSSPGDVPAPTMELVASPIPRSNDEIDDGIHTGREALMEILEKLKSEIFSEGIESNWNRCEMEKKSDEQREFSPLIDATPEAAASELNVMKEAAALANTTSVNVTQGTTRNVMESVVPNENKNNPTEISLADVLKALGNNDPDNESLRHLSILDVARRRGVILTPSWWPKEGLEVKI